jgi:hypothetical protein
MKPGINVTFLCQFGPKNDRIAGKNGALSGGTGFDKRKEKQTKTWERSLELTLEQPTPA